MVKRYRTPTAKPGELKIAYGKERGNNSELFFCWGGEGAGKRDSNMLMHFFHQARLADNGRSLVEELQARGFDITTLKFSVKQSAVN